MHRLPTIGIVMDFFRPSVIEGAAVYARENGLLLDPRWAVRADWMPKQPLWDGVLANFTDMETIYNQVMQLGLPVVHLSGWLRGSALPRVQHDFAACASMAVEEFEKLQLERVAGLGLRVDPIDRQAYRGLRVALNHAGIAFERLPFQKGNSLENQVKHLADVLEKVERPFGLFMVHAGLTWSLLEELKERGLRVPEDLAIIVIDKDAQQTCALASVPLTAVTLDDWQQGFDAAALVHRLILGSQEQRRIIRIRPLGLHRRNSTGATKCMDPHVAKALYLIAGPIDPNLTVSHLAARVGVSRRTLEQSFRAVTGATPHSAILARRIIEARRLLEKGMASITEISESCGFSSVHYFCTAFKRETGKTPSDCRKNR